MKGKDRHIKRLTRLQKMSEAANRTLYVGADLIRGEAMQSISRGSVSGKGHIPSAPGEPPNRDTGDLQSKITVTFPKPLVAEVSSDARHAAPLEFGTSKMKARPYMRPARDKMEPVIQRFFAQEVDEMVKRSGK